MEKSKFRWRADDGLAFGSGHVKFESSTRQISKHRYQVSSVESGEILELDIYIWDYIEIFKAI